MQPDLFAPGVGRQCPRIRAEIAAKKRHGAARPVRPDDGPVGRDGRGQAVLRQRAHGRSARGFYPADLTKEQFDDYLASHPAEAEALTSPYTVVKRQGDKLVAVPYSQNISSGSSRPPS